MNKALLERIGVMTAVYGDYISNMEKAAELQILIKEIEIAIGRVPKLDKVKDLLERERRHIQNSVSDHITRAEYAKRNVIVEVSRVTEEWRGEVK